MQIYENETGFVSLFLFMWFWRFRELRTWLWAEYLWSVSRVKIQLEKFRWSRKTLVCQAATFPLPPLSSLRSPHGRRSGVFVVTSTSFLWTQSDVNSPDLATGGREVSWDSQELESEEILVIKTSSLGPQSTRNLAFQLTLWMKLNVKHRGWGLMLETNSGSKFMCLKMYKK